jgi:hypothetical protein
VNNSIHISKFIELGEEETYEVWIVPENFIKHKPSLIHTAKNLASAREFIEETGGFGEYTIVRNINKRQLYNISNIT